MYWIFSTFRPLVGRLNWSISLDILDFVRFFDFSNSCWEVKMIDLNEYFGFFRLFDFSTSWWEVIMINITEYIDIFSTSRPLAGRSNWSILLELLDFLTYQPLTGRSKWLILLNIMYFIDFSTSWWEVKLIDFTEYIGYFWLFDFSTCC